MYRNLKKQKKSRSMSTYIYNNFLYIYITRYSRDSRQRRYGELDVENLFTYEETFFSRIVNNYLTFGK